MEVFIICDLGVSVKSWGGRLNGLCRVAMKVLTYLWGGGGSGKNVLVCATSELSYNVSKLRRVMGVSLSIMRGHIYFKNSRRQANEMSTPPQP